MSQRIRYIFERFLKFFRRPPNLIKPIRLAKITRRFQKFSRSLTKIFEVDLRVKTSAILRIQELLFWKRALDFQSEIRPSCVRYR